MGWAGLAVWWGVGLGVSTVAMAQEAPLAVVIVLDAASAGYMGPWGEPKPTTPHLDALAAQSVVFDQASSQSATTGPSTASLFTGAWVHEHTADDTQAQDQQLPMLAELLAARGVYTHAAIANPNALSDRRGLSRGFGVVDEVFRGLGRGPDGKARLPGPEAVVKVADAVLPASAGRPTFLYLHFLQPHTPYDPPEPYASQFGVDASHTWTEVEALMEAVNGGAEAPAWLRPQLEARYRGNMAWVDDGVAQVVARLRTLGLYEDALIIVTADHGDAFGDHGHYGHNVALHADQTHIPLIVKPPRLWQAPSGRVPAPVDTVDLTATLLAWFDVPQPAHVRGDDLTPLVRRRTDTTPHPDVLQSVGNLFRHALRVGTDKVHWARSGALELYDLVVDAREMEDLSKREVATAELLRGRGRAMVGDAKETGEVAGKAEGGDAEEQELLQELGYVE